MYSFLICNIFLQLVPGWTAFNMMLRKNQAPRESIVAYTPTINSSPTELSTVYEILDRSITMGNATGQEDIIVVFDQAIYAKAVEIVWQSRAHFR